MRKKNKKGQAFSMDSLVSLLGFFLLMAFLFSLWNVYSLKLNSNLASEEMHILAFGISDMLTKTQGLPYNWPNSNATSYGLADHTGKLSEDKVNAFFSLDNESIKRNFNIERFSYKAEILEINGTAIYSIGENTTDDTEESLAVISSVILDGEARDFVFTLWRE